MNQMQVNLLNQTNDTYTKLSMMQIMKNSGNITDEERSLLNIFEQHEIMNLGRNNNGNTR